MSHWRPKSLLGRLRKGSEYEVAKPKLNGGKRLPMEPWNRNAGGIFSDLCNDFPEHFVRYLFYCFVVGFRIEIYMYIYIYPMLFKISLGTFLKQVDLATSTPRPHGSMVYEVLTLRFPSFVAVVTNCFYLGIGCGLIFDELLEVLEVRVSPKSLQQTKRKLAPEKVSLEEAWPQSGLTGLGARRGESGEENLPPRPSGSEDRKILSKKGRHEESRKDVQARLGGRRIFVSKYVGICRCKS